MTTHQGIEKNACELCDEKASTVQTTTDEVWGFVFCFVLFFLTKTEYFNSQYY